MTLLTGRDGTPVVAIVGWKNSGKTTLTVRLVAELVSRGYAVATVKHAHHEFQVDDGETDSARHRRAGAQQVAVVSFARIALIRELAGAPEPSLAEVLQKLDPCDIIIAEGYKRAPVLKIEARRGQSAAREPLAPGDAHVIAVAADHTAETGGVPLFGLDDVKGLADLIERDVMASRRSSPRSAGPVE
jgi:molybdopterin-guanine dinucleotide biosynthesis protein B